MVSRDHGWREFNPSQNSLGFIRNRTLPGPGDLPDLITEQHPDIVFIALELNDTMALTVSADHQRGSGAASTLLKCCLPACASSWSNRAGTRMTARPR